MLTYVVAKDSTRLMPTYNIKKVRKLLKSGRARIFTHNPGFTIQLLYDLPKQDAPYVQPIEICEDTGDHHIGVSVKSEKHEFVHAQYDVLADEKKRHDDCRRYRRSRRNRKRYRRPKGLDNNKPKGWFAPSVRHKVECHLNIIRRYERVLPITSAVLETAKFDTQLLEAQQTGKKLPEGTDYQHGPKYQLENLRTAVFTRDHYTCQVCGKSVEDGAILRIHHALYWKNDHTDRMSGLMTVCTKCHTPANHKPGGKLWGITPKVRSMASAAFMNAMRLEIFRRLKAEFPDLEQHRTNGVHTKLTRLELGVPKTHADDAYCMGEFHPRHKAHELHYQKKRRNNRVLSKFYDAQYIDYRDDAKEAGSALGSNRTSRSVPRNNPGNLRRFRKSKVSAGHMNTRKKRYAVQAGDVILYQGVKRKVHGLHANGTNVEFVKDGIKSKSAATKNVKVLYHEGGWRILPA